MKKTTSKNKLTDSNYWDNNWNKKNYSFYDIFKNIFVGINNYDFYSLFRKYSSKKKKYFIFEVGCAPANYLIYLKKRFGFNISGIEYSKEGYLQVKNNFHKNQIADKIIFGDFFDYDFLKRNKEKYDIVYSIGFIEHFENPKNAIEKHFEILKNNGICIISIPNLNGVNSLLTEKKILDVHNRKIMDLKRLRKLFSKYEILELRYGGGLFNWGLFSYDNWFLEKIRFFFFAFQRVFIDPIFILLHKMGIQISYKYTSPQIIVVCRKK